VRPPKKAEATGHLRVVKPCPVGASGGVHAVRSGVPVDGPTGVAEAREFVVHVWLLSCGWGMRPSRVMGWWTTSPCDCASRRAP
jgi:hypothetical protein